MVKFWKKATAGAALVLASSAALADVPTGVEAVFTGITADFGTLLGYGYVAMGVILAGGVVMGLVRAVVKKSTRA